MGKGRAINNKMWAWAKFQLEHGRSQREVAEALFVDKRTLIREIDYRGGYEKKPLVCPEEYFFEITTY